MPPLDVLESSSPQPALQTYSRDSIAAQEANSSSTANSSCVQAADIGQQHLSVNRLLNELQPALQQPTSAAAAAEAPCAELASQSDAGNPAYGDWYV